jgi:hypothetical protein
VALMIRVRVIVEGQTEASFVSGPLTAGLMGYGVFLFPTLLGVPGQRGGRVNYDRVKKDVVTALKQDQGVYCTTLFDLYGLGAGFDLLVPDRAKGGQQLVADLEHAMHRDISKAIPSLRTERFIPYVQIYEFEGLLFSDPRVLAESMSREDLADQIELIRADHTTPEEINDGPETAPSKRLLRLDPRYDKVRTGTVAAERMGIHTICQHCPRFRAWFERLATLGIGA